MAEKTFDDLFLDTLKDIYYAEKQSLKASPKMARASQSEEGKAAFLKHKEQTEGQLERLQQVFELLGKPARARPVRPFRALSPRPKKSSTSSRARSLWTLALSRRPRLLNTMKSPATAR